MQKIEERALSTRFFLSAHQRKRLHLHPWAWAFWHFHPHELRILLRIEANYSEVSILRTMTTQKCVCSLSIQTSRTETSISFSTANVRMILPTKNDSWSFSCVKKLRHWGLGRIVEMRQRKENKTSKFISRTWIEQNLERKRKKRGVSSSLTHERASERARHSWSLYSTWIDLWQKVRPHLPGNYTCRGEGRKWKRLWLFQGEQGRSCYWLSIVREISANGAFLKA